MANLRARSFRSVRILISAGLFGAAGGSLRADVFAEFSVGQSSYCVQAVCGNNFSVCGLVPGSELSEACDAPCGSHAEADGRCSFVPGPLGIKEVVWTASTHAACDENCSAIARFVTHFVVITVIDRPVAFQLALDQAGHSNLSYTWPLGEYSEVNEVVGIDTTPRQGVLAPGTYSIRVSAQSACTGRTNSIGGAGTINVNLKFGAIFWNNPGGGEYRLAQNWAPAQVPVHNQLQSDIAIIGMPGNLEINFTEATAGRLLVRHPSNVDIWGGGEVFGPNQDEPSLGIGGGGRLNVIGGTFRSVHACIGDEAVAEPDSDHGAAAQVEVSHPGTCWESAGTIEIGRAAEGRLFVSSGCVNSRDVCIGIGAPGEVRVNRLATRDDVGKLSCENLIVGAGRDVPGRGIVQIENGGRVDCLQASVGETGWIHGDGVLAVLERVENRGLIAPGLSVGILTIEGDYVQQSSGILELEISGAGPGQFDILHVTGDATLGGIMKLKFVGDYVPASGAAFACLDVGGGIVGHFAAVQVEGLPRGYQVAIDPETGAATVRSRFELAEVVIRGIRAVPELVNPQPSAP